VIRALGGDQPLDSLGMFAAAGALPELLDSSIEDAAGLGRLDAVPTGAVVALGDGPARGAAEMVGAVVGATARVPLVGVSGGDLPGFVGRDSLVFVTAFTGDEPDACAAARDAVRRGARLVAITRGGELGRLAAEAGAPVVSLPDVPRARGALLAMVVALLVGLERAGLVEPVGAALVATSRQAAHRRDALMAAGGGVAGELARRIGRTFPMLCGASGLGAAAARWWQSEIAANARTLAVVASAPELLADTIAAFGQAGDVTRQVLTLVELRSDFEPAPADRAFGRVDELLAEVVADRLVVRAEGAGPLAQLVDLVVVGEFVSLRLAAAAGVDPGPAPAIDESPGGAPGAGLRRRRRPG
jgi:glucose/mannose-6-phosphate isomerase